MTHTPCFKRPSRLDRVSPVRQSAEKCFEGEDPRCVTAELSGSSSTNY